MKPVVFKSKMTSVSVLDHVFECFGYEAARTAIVTTHAWGVMVDIVDGEHAGAYDVHYNGPLKGLTFIAA